MASPPRIHILPTDTAKRIAAGEVIERPASVLRELLDNALDAGATAIEAEIEGGGIASLRVTDNGCGMCAEDLALAVLPHATSKIATLDDLLTARTLGFRGEALASVAAVARLEILSAEADGTPHRLVSFPDRPAVVEPSAGRPGTTVRIMGLFDSYPARKLFLKRPASESAHCRQVFVDKALAFSAVSFRLLSDGRIAIFLPPSDPAGRVAALYAPDSFRGLVTEAVLSGPGFGGRAVLGDPALARPDRRHTQVFVNGRRVPEYALLTALDWAYSSVLPGGEHPFAFLFLDVDPALVDFNIHPAKREVRFRDIESMRRAVLKSIQGALGDRARLSPYRDPPAEPTLWEVREGIPNPGTRHDERKSWARIAELASCVREARGTELPGACGESGGAVPPDWPRECSAGFRFLGAALGVFLVYEEDGALWLLDQHAAHERLLFEGLRSGPPIVQELLVPLAVEPESDEEEAWLISSSGALRQAGYLLEREGPRWLLTGMPAGLRGGDSGAILELLRARPAPDALLLEAHAATACRAAVKDGDILDRAAALDLIALSRELPEPRCPHGRPVRLRFGKDELYRLVKRLV
ncbi:MAG TPA: DNA mismatch repair endonuclease MutL [Magnetospirillaceae bacterium]|nr:DNA mismatch repair endonuclease MutL [Magnetospirillaceae bacterium]